MVEIRQTGCPTGSVYSPSSKGLTLGDVHWQQPQHMALIANIIYTHSTVFGIHTRMGLTFRRRRTRLFRDVFEAVLERSLRPTPGGKFRSPLECD